MTPLSLFEDPEVLEVQVVASDEVRIVPSPPTESPPTETNVLFPYVPLGRSFEVPEVLEVQVLPSEEVRMIPF